MRLTRFHLRAVYAVLLLLAFFLPAYGQNSAAGFIWKSVGAIRTDAELTMLDLLVLLIPLLLVLVAAVIILLRSVQQRSVSSLVLSLPLFALLFFVLILFLDMSRQVTTGDVPTLLQQMGIGFYLGVLASTLLLLSYSRREAMNLSSRRR